MLRKELKEKFLRDLTPSERLFFLKKAREAIDQKRYPPSEDLFWYCYSLSIRERMRQIQPAGSEGYLRFLLVQGAKDTDEAIRMYGERLEKKKLPEADSEGHVFIEYFSE
ncbi:MAG: hypothetical protein EHM54_08055 [Nitrospiraceae bacterium]|nr:MAG: hypothetical protein EHM54_08055 [Nitrospiraceae bacterium]